MSATTAEGSRLLRDEMSVLALEIGRAASSLATTLVVLIGGGHVWQAVLGSPLAWVVLLDHVDGWVCVDFVV